MLAETIFEQHQQMLKITQHFKLLETITPLSYIQVKSKSQLRVLKDCKTIHHSIHSETKVHHKNTTYKIIRDEM